MIALTAVINATANHSPVHHRHATSTLDCNNLPQNSDQTTIDYCVNQLREHSQAGLDNQVP